MCPQTFYMVSSLEMKSLLISKSLKVKSILLICWWQYNFGISLLVNMKTYFAAKIHCTLLNIVLLDSFLDRSGKGWNYTFQNSPNPLLSLGILGWQPSMVPLIFRSIFDLETLNEAKSLNQKELTQLSTAPSVNETENSAMSPLGRHNARQRFSYWRRFGRT